MRLQVHGTNQGERSDTGSAAAAAQRTLVAADMYDVCPEDDAVLLSRAFESAWEAEQRRALHAACEPAIWRAFGTVLWPRYRCGTRPCVSGVVQRPQEAAAARRVHDARTCAPAGGRGRS